MRLTPRNHDRDAAGLTYVYPVVSRRARGVSVGVNLNPNNACNWRCRYCQVPNLVLGKAPRIDLPLLRRELEGMLHDLVRGNYLERHVPEFARRINDVAFSGNGEPTSSKQFADTVQIAVDCVAAYEELDATKIVLITNGSLTHQPDVQKGLRLMAEAGGEVWFKLDSVTAEGQAATNGNRAGVDKTRRNLVAAARLCPTWLQTMVFALDGAPPPESEVTAWLDFVGGLVDDGVPLHGVLLYGLARQSHQPDAGRLYKVDPEWFEEFAARIRALGLEVRPAP